MTEHATAKDVTRSVPKELFRLVLAICLLAVVTFVMVVIQLNNDIINLENGNAFRRIIHDRILDAKARPVFGLVVPDFILGAYMFGSFILHVIFVKPRFRIVLTLRRFFFLTTTGYVMRAFSLMGTVLPPSSPECIHISELDSNVPCWPPNLCRNHLHRPDVLRPYPICNFGDLLLVANV